MEAVPKEREKASNTDILRESWSKKALIVAFTGYVHLIGHMFHLTI